MKIISQREKVLDVPAKCASRGTEEGSILATCLEGELEFGDI